MQGFLEPVFLKFNAIDYLFLIIFLFFSLNGYRKAFLGQIIPVLGFFIGILIGIFMYQGVLNSISFDSFLDWNSYTLYNTHKEISKGSYIYAFAAFILSFIAVRFAFYYLNKFLSQFLTLIYLNWINRILGFLLGFFKALLINIFIILFLTHPYFEFLNMNYLIHNSFLAYYIYNFFLDYLFKNEIQYKIFNFFVIPVKFLEEFLLAIKGLIK